MEIKFNIPEEYVERIIKAIKGMYPIPTTQEYPEAPAIPEFTDAQWAKERVRRFILNTVRNFEQKKVIDEAIAGISIPGDIIT